MPDSFELIYRRLQASQNYELRYIALEQNHVSLLAYWNNCCSAVRAISTTQYVFLCDASDVISCLPLRQETKVVQLWHACGAFKKWGMSTADLIFGGNRKDLLRHPFYKNLSLVTVSSPEVIWAYVEAMALDEQSSIVKATGVSRTDKFFDNKFISESRKEIEIIVPTVRGKKIILYAPTFRGRVSSAAAPNELDIAMLRQELGDDYVLLIKHHPYVKNLPLIPSECQDFAFDVTRITAIDNLICVADVCITDYSSVVFEYSLFGRPIVFFAYDIDEYSDWRGFYYNYDDMTPGPVFKDNQPMIDYLSHLNERFNSQDIKDFCNKFMFTCDGQATERIISLVFDDA